MAFFVFLLRNFSIKEWNLFKIGLVAYLLFIFLSSFISIIFYSAFFVCLKYVRTSKILAFFYFSSVIF